MGLYGLTCGDFMRQFWRFYESNDMHCREPHAAAPVHGDPLAGLHVSLVDDGPVTRHVAAAERRSRKGVDTLGKPDAIQVRGGDRDVLRPSAGAVHRRDDLVIAEVLVRGILHSFSS